MLRRGRRPCARSHALACTLLAWLTGCEPSVAARAVWIDAEAEPGSVRVQVYDHGQRYEHEVLGVEDPVASVQLGPRGRSVLIRSGPLRGAWLDLVDGRRFPLLLAESRVGEGVERFADDESALLWSDYLASTLYVLPLAPGLALARGEDGSVLPLVRATSPRWWVSASAAPVALSLEPDGRTLALWTWPDDPSEALRVVELASAEFDEVPSNPRVFSACASASGCYSLVELDPQGELAIFGLELGSEWQVFDRRGPSGPLELHAGLATLADQSGIGIVRVLDRDRSVWIGSGLIHLWNRRSAELSSLPVLGDPPFHTFAVDGGAGVVLISASGPVLLADGEGLRAVSLTTSPCAQASPPVVSPQGRWAAWTCFDVDGEVSLTQGVVIRVSALGLERFVGVPMRPLAIDERGELLLYSVETILDDSLDGVEAADVPRNLFVLAHDGVLARVDSLEPSPSPVLAEGRLGTFIQAAAIVDESARAPDAR